MPGRRPPASWRSSTIDFLPRPINGNDGRARSGLPSGRLDLHHLRPEVGQRLGRLCPGGAVRQVEHPQARERPSGRACLGGPSVPPHGAGLSENDQSGPFEYTELAQEAKRGDREQNRLTGPTADDDTEPVILTEVTDRVGTITLNRPARRNALNGELIGALDDAVRQMADDPDAKVIVLTGAARRRRPRRLLLGRRRQGRRPRRTRAARRASRRTRCSGDLSRHDLHAAMLLHLMPKPTIAMVGGPAVGAGCSLAAACDLRFASEDAVFATNFSPNGLSGDYGGSFFWTRIGGTALARRLYLLNEKIPAPRALELGMVHAVLPPAELRAYTYEVADQLVRTPATLLGPGEGQPQRRPRTRWNVGAGSSPTRPRTRGSRPRIDDGASGAAGNRRRRAGSAHRDRLICEALLACSCDSAAFECRAPDRRRQRAAPHGDRGGDGAQDAGGDHPAWMLLHGTTLCPKCWGSPRGQLRTCRRISPTRLAAGHGPP